MKNCLVMVKVIYKYLLLTMILVFTGACTVGMDNQKMSHLKKSFLLNY